MRPLRAGSLCLCLLCLFCSSVSKAQINWQPFNFRVDGGIQFFWLDEGDSTLYVAGSAQQNYIVGTDTTKMKYGFRYRKGVVSKLPFEDSLKGQMYSMRRFQRKLHITDGYRFGSWDSVNGWKTAYLIYNCYEEDWDHTNKPLMQAAVPGLTMGSIQGHRRYTSDCWQFDPTTPNFAGGKQLPTFNIADVGPTAAYQINATYNVGSFMTFQAQAL